MYAWAGFEGRLVKMGRWGGTYRFPQMYRSLKDRAYVLVDTRHAVGVFYNIVPSQLVNFLYPFPQLQPWSSQWSLHSHPAGVPRPTPFTPSPVHRHTCALLVSITSSSGYGTSPHRHSLEPSAAWGKPKAFGLRVQTVFQPHIRMSPWCLMLLLPRQFPFCRQFQCLSISKFWLPLLLLPGWLAHLALLYEAVLWPLSTASFMVRL